MLTWIHVRGLSVNKISCVFLVLVSLQNVFIPVVAKDSKDRAGPELQYLSLEENRLEIQAADESGLKTVRLILNHNSRTKTPNKRIVFRLSKFNQNTSTSLSRVLKYPQNIEAGTWKISIILIDKNGNKTKLSPKDLEASGFQSQVSIDSKTDTTAPELIALSFSRTLSPSPEIQIVEVQLQCKDNSKELRIAGIFQRTKKIKTSLAYTNESESYNGDISDYKLRFRFPASAKLGEWKLKIKVFDSSFNKSVYSYKKLKKLGLPASINVTEPIKEIETTENNEEGDSSTEEGEGVDTKEDFEVLNPNQRASSAESSIIVEQGYSESLLKVPELNIQSPNSTASMDFLFSGKNPLQVGVNADQIDRNKISIIRGKVLNQSMEPIQGAKVAILNHLEFGSTKTLANGEYNIALYGDTVRTMQISAPGFLAIQRTINVPKQDFYNMEDVILTRLDTKSKDINFTNSNNSQILQGSKIKDRAGERQATLIVLPGTHASIVLNNGSTINPSNATIRATEYTVGSNGIEAMPGTLPSSSMYTYALELSLDEAIATNSDRVNFDKGIPIYVDNFLHFPTGEIVPVGYYDKSKAAWIASKNGRVVEVLGKLQGKAILDITGRGFPASKKELLELDVTDEELVQLANLYETGKSLWRICVDHFSPWDINWPGGPPGDAIPPPANSPPENEDDNSPPNPCKQVGSIIECESQVLGESISIAGTPFTLEYRSDRVPGRKTGRTLNIPLSGETIPSSLKEIALQVNTLGKSFKRVFTPEKNLMQSFTWDGMDVYGRKVLGTIDATIDIAYKYNAIYYQGNNAFENSFGIASNADPNSLTRFIGDEREESITIVSRHIKELTNNDLASQIGLGAWTISSHHYYDPISKTLFKGSGETQRINEAPSFVSFPYNGQTVFPNRDVPIYFPNKIEIGANGDLYLSDTSTIRKINTNGTHTKLTNHNGCTYGAENIVASSVCLYYPRGITLDSEGNLYATEARTGSTDGGRIVKIDSNGILTTIAGGIGHEAGFSGDGGQALDAQINQPWDLDIGPDGSIYFIDRFNHRIRKISPDGIISTIAGNEKFFFSGDNTLATESGIGLPESIKLKSDGSVLFSSHNNRIYMISPEGLLRRIAGNDYGFSGDGDLAENAEFHNIKGFDIDQHGNIFIADSGNHRIRKIDTTGIVSTIAGNGTPLYKSSNMKPGALANTQGFAFPQDIATNTNGEIFFIHSSRIVKIQNNFTRTSNGKLYVADRGGKEIFTFDKNGKHLATHDAFSNERIYDFAYSEDGYLTKITDQFSNETIIERQGSKPIAIIGPNSVRTELSIDNNNYLNSVTNAAGERFNMDHTRDGLLTNFINPRSYISKMTYDSLGRLTTDKNAADGSWTITRKKEKQGYEVQMKSAENRTLKHKVKRLDDGTLQREFINSEGEKSTSLIYDNGKTILTKQDGTVIKTIEGPDPRFLMNAPLVEQYSISTPNGLEKLTMFSREVVSNGSTGFPLLETQVDMVKISNGSSTVAYDAKQGRTRLTSFEGRTRYTISRNGLLLESGRSKLYPTYFKYDNHGRLTKISRGESPNERTTNFKYAENGFISKITNPLGETVSIIHDVIGRVIQQKFANNDIIDFEFDGNDNLNSLNTPKNHKHSLSYNPVDLLEEYGPPFAINSQNTIYSYNRDKQKTKEFRPDGKVISYDYKPNTSQISTISFSRGSFNYHYQNGKLTEATAPGNQILKYKYDGPLLTAVEWDGDIKADIKLNYDNQFRLVSREIDDTDLLVYKYDRDNLLTQGGSLNFTYNGSNALLERTILNAINSSFEYSLFGEISSESHTYNDNPLYTALYERDKLGRIIEKKETILGETRTFDYRYDTRGRLAQVIENNEIVRTYGFDKNNNRTFLNNAAIANYDAQDRLLNYGKNSYSYGANGELRSKKSASIHQTYDYDEFGNLNKVTLTDGTQIDYIVDAQNRRIGKKLNGKMVKSFIYKDQLNPIAEINSSGKIVSKFIYGSKIHVPDYMIKNGQEYRIISNQVGSVLLVVDSTSGSIRQRISYDEFGNIVSDSNPGFQPFGFAGGLFDQHTKLTRFGIRDYDAETGRWTAKDPIRFAGGQVNLYSYLNNGPINAIDISGTARFGYGPIQTGFGDLQSPFTNPISNIFNNELAHEQLFFDDGLTPANTGLFPEGHGTIESMSNPQKPLSRNDFREFGPIYDDAIMREAVNNLGNQNYCILGSNCQDYAEKLRREYDKLIGGKNKGGQCN